MRMVILDAATTSQGADLWAPLRELGDLTVHPRTAPSEVVARLAGADVALTNKVPITAADLAGAPSVRYVGVLATGYNVIDVAACRTRGVAVANVPGYSTTSVAQQVMAFLLHHVNGIAAHAAAVRAGQWSSSSDFCFTLHPLRELAGQTLAVIGSGAIGGEVIRLAEAFGMQVVRCAVPGSTSQGRIPWAEALPRADAVTLHCPLTPATAKLANAEFFAQLKPGAVLINTARGGLIDELALLAALRDGHLGAACLDVLTTEPPPADNPLIAALRTGAPWTSRLTVTPHIAWATVEARRRLVAEAAANVQAFMRGERRHRVD